MTLNLTTVKGIHHRWQSSSKNGCAICKGDVLVKYMGASMEGPKVARHADGGRGSGEGRHSPSTVLGSGGYSAEN